MTKPTFIKATLAGLSVLFLAPQALHCGYSSFNYQQVHPRIATQANYSPQNTFSPGEEVILPNQYCEYHSIRGAIWGKITQVQNNGYRVKYYEEQDEDGSIIFQTHLLRPEDIGKLPR